MGKIKGIVFTVISAVIFGVTPVLGRMTYDMGSNAVTLGFFRNLFSIPALLAVILVTKSPLKISLGRFKDIAIVGVLGNATTTILLYSSYSYVGVGTATTLHFLYPIFVAVACVVLFREKLGKIKLLCLLGASIGILFFADRNSSGNLAGVLMALASGATYSIYMVGVDKKGLKELNPFQLTLYFSIVIGAAILVYGLITGSLVWKLSPLAYFYTAVVAVGASFFAVVLLQLGIKYLGASTAAIFCMFEPVTGVAAGSLFLGEPATPSKIVGCVMILASVTALVVSDRKKAEEPSAEGQAPKQEPEEAVMR